MTATALAAWAQQESKPQETPGKITIRRVLRVKEPTETIDGIVLKPTRMNNDGNTYFEKQLYAGFAIKATNRRT